MKIDLRKFDKLTANQWEKKIFYRGVNHKVPKLLKVNTNEMYPKKLDRLNDRLLILRNVNYGKISSLIKVLGVRMIEDLEEQGISFQDAVDEEAEFLNTKIQRIIDKYATCLKMIDLRDKKKVPNSGEWKMHGTIYYIDLNAGDDDLNDGLSIENPWLTIQKYTTVTARTAGDIAKVRANTTQTMGAADCVFDEDGTSNDMIEIRGCSIADDPWGDSSDVKPIFDWNSGAYRFHLSIDHYWKFNNVEMRNGTHSNGALYGINVFGIWVLNCKFNSNVDGCNFSGIDYVRIEDTEFVNNSSEGISFGVGSQPIYPIKGCIFNGIGSRAIRGVSYFTTVLVDCSFGQSVSFTSDDIYLDYGANLVERNCIWDKGVNYYGYELSKHTLREDVDQVFEAHRLERYQINVERETIVVRAGGADTSAKMTGLSSNLSLFRYETLSGISIFGAFKVWLAASVEKTITIYIRGFGWTGFPTAAQLFVRAEYYGSAVNCIRTILDSDEVIANNNDWVAFQVTLTPAREGFVYLDVFLGKYESACGVYVDIKPVVS